MREQPYHQPSHEHAIRSMLLRSQRSPGGLYLPGGPVLARRRMPSILPGLSLAPVHVQTVANSGNSSTVSVTIMCSAGSLLRVAFRTADEPFDNTTPISSSPAEAWTVDKEFERTAGNPQMLNAYALNVAGGSTTISGTLPGGGSAWVAKVMEFSGIALTSAFDVGADQTDVVGVIKESGNTAATSQADAVAIGSFSATSGSPTWAVGANGYTITSGGTDMVAVEYKILSATGVQNADIDFGADEDADCRVAVFKAAGGGAVKARTLALLGVG